MPDVPEPHETSETPAPMSGDLSEIVRRALLQLGELRELESRAQEVGARISRITLPPPNPNKSPAEEPGK